MKSPISIRTLLTLPFILQMVGIVGLTGYLSWQNGQKAVRSLVIELQDEVSDRIEQKLASFLSTPELITELNQKAVSSGELDLKNITALQQRGWQQISTFTTISLVQFGTEIGNFVAVERRSENTFATAIKDNTTAGKIQTYGLDQQTGQLNQPLSLTAEKYDPRTRSWYQTVASSQKPQWIKIYAWVEQDVLSLTFVRPLFSQVRQGTSTQTEFVGVTGADLSFEELDQFLERQRLGQNGKMFIIERSGELVASSTAESIFEIIDGQLVRTQAIKSQNSLIQSATKTLLEKFSSLAKIQQLNRFDFEVDGQHNFLQVAPLQDEYGLDWLIISVVPKADFTQQINQHNRVTILLCLGALGLSVILGILTSRRLTRPIIQLSQAVKTWSLGTENPAVRGSQIQELNILSNTLNQMSQSLQQSYQQLEDYSRNLEQKVINRTEALAEKVQIAEAAEEALRESEAKFSTIFLGTPHPIIITRIRDRKYIDVNDSFCRITGYSREEVIDRSSLELNLWVTPEDYDDFYQTLDLDQKIRNYEVNFRTKTGEIRTALVSTDLIIINQEPCLLSSSNDITEKKRTEVALRVSEAKFSQAFKASPDMIIIASFTDRAILEVNDSLMKILGYSKEEVVGHTALELDLLIDSEYLTLPLLDLPNGINSAIEKLVYEKKRGRLFQSCSQQKLFKLRPFNNACLSPLTSVI